MDRLQGHGPTDEAVNHAIANNQRKGEGEEEANTDERSDHGDGASHGAARSAEMARLKYENSFLVSAETVLESKCAALDSRLEEALATIKVQARLLSERGAEYEMCLKELAISKLTCKTLEEAVGDLKYGLLRKQSELDKIESKAAKFKEQEEALELQLLATADACEALERERDHASEAERRARLAEQDQAYVEQLLNSAKDRELYVQSIETQLEALRIERAEDRATSNAESKAREGEQARTLQRAKEAKERDALAAHIASRTAAAADAAKVRMEDALKAVKEETLEQRERAMVAELKLGQAQAQLQQAQNLVLTEQEKVRSLEEEVERLKADSRIAAESYATKSAMSSRELEAERLQVAETRKLITFEKQRVKALQDSQEKLQKFFKDKISHHENEIMSSEQDRKNLRKALEECEALVAESVAPLFQQTPSLSEKDPHLGSSASSAFAFENGENGAAASNTFFDQEASLSQQLDQSLLELKRWKVNHRAGTTRRLANAIASAQESSRVPMHSQSLSSRAVARSRSPSEHRRPSQCSAYRGRDEAKLKLQQISAFKHERHEAYRYESPARRQSMARRQTKMGTSLYSPSRTQKNSDRLTQSALDI